MPAFICNTCGTQYAPSDKPPAACRYDQLETTAPFELEAIFGS